MKLTVTLLCVFALVHHTIAAGVDPVPVAEEMDMGEQVAHSAMYPTNYYGVDVSQPVSESEFKCLRDANLQFAVIRCYRSTDSPDSACPGSVAAAHAAGMAVSTYFFPRPHSGDAAGQMSKFVSFVEEHNLRFDKLWLDIEGPQYWHSSQSENQAFFNDLASAAKRSGFKTAVYSSKSQWCELFGCGFVGEASGMELWYAHYDGVPTFGDFEPFGAWTSPYMKQFTDRGSKCGVSYDISWRANL